MIKEIKVLNIAQPNAHYVMFNDKNIENRSMVSYFRGTIAIYASATFNKNRFKDSLVEKDQCSFGSIIGFVDIVDCIVEEELTEETKEWFGGPYGYVFKNVRVLNKPIEVKPPKGAIVWWTLEGEQVAQCLEQINLNTYRPVQKIKADPNKPKAKNDNRRGKFIPSVELSYIIGIEPMSHKQAFTYFLDYVEDEDIFENIEGENDCIITPNDAIKKLTDKSKLNLKDCNDILITHLEKCTKEDAKFNPTENLAAIIGEKPISLKGALDKTLAYIEQNELLNDEDEYMIIYSDEKIKKLTGKESISEEVFGKILRDNLK